MNFSIHLVLAGLFTTQVCFAQIPTLPGQAAMTPGAEYFAGKFEGKPLIKVNVVSGLRLSGVYHVPIDTDLAELISYAGGATDGAELDEVRVSSENQKGREMKVYDFYSISKDNQKMPMLNNGDVVQIDVAKDSLSRTAIWVGIFGTITTVVLSTLAYQKSR